MILLQVHAAATLALVGLIWFVQIVHYPLFDLASERRFERFSAEHSRRTSLVVVPLMLTEAVTAFVLLIAPPSDAVVWPAVAGAALLGLIWLSTAVVQVPLHRRLGRSRDLRAIRRLVASNWIRTAAWTARGWLALVMLRTPPS